MKVKCISNKFGNHSITIDKSYVVFAGMCIENKDDIKSITSIYIQNDSGDIGIYEMGDFKMQNMSFEKYSFVSSNKDEFLFDSIAYDGFWSMFYTDSQDGLADYLKAKQDFKQAKMILYREYSLEELQVRISNENLDERDFIFEFLRNEQHESFIEFAIDLIRDGMRKIVKYYEVQEAFNYLASFRKKTVENFFVEYISNDVWENEKINEVVYSYLGGNGTEVIYH